MNKIAQAIAALLYDHDVVTVPGLGAFVRHDEGARVNVITNEFERPTSSLSFDAQQREENSLITDYLMRQEEIDENEARQQLATFVSECYATLMAGDAVSIPEVGELRFNDQQEVVFQQTGNSNFNGDAFGLSDIHPKPIFGSEAAKDWKEQVKQQIKDKNTPMTVDTGDDHQNKPWWILGVLLLIIAGLLLWYFVFRPAPPKPVDPNPIDTVAVNDTVSVLPDTITLPLDTLAIPLDSLSTEVDSVEVPPVDTVRELATSAEVIVPSDEMKAFIVGGCFSMEPNALSMANAAMEQGCEDAFVMKRGKMFYVCYGQFATAAEAKAVLPEIKEAYNKKAWILTK